MPNYKGFVTFKNPVICLDCSKVVPRAGGRQKRCPSCQKIHRLKIVNASMHKYYMSRYREHHRAYEKNKRQRVRTKLFSIVGDSCKICGYNKFSCSLDFHHIDNSRKRNDKEYMNLSFEDYTNLITLCRNCHQAVHNGFLQLTRVKRL